MIINFAVGSWTMIVTLWNYYLQIDYLKVDCHPVLVIVVDLKLMPLPNETNWNLPII